MKLIIAVIKPDVASAAVRDISKPYDKNNRVGETNKIIINKNLRIPGYNLSAPDLEDNKIIRERYFELIISRLEKLTNQNIKDHIVYKKSYAIRDFKKDYHSFKGNAYGLANTLFQTAILKPSLRNKKIKNLFFCGQLTVPGPGVPPSLISGNVVANELIKDIS